MTMLRRMFRIASIIGSSTRCENQVDSVLGRGITGIDHSVEVVRREFGFRLLAR